MKAAAIIISQQENGKWPFMMTDSTENSTLEPITIPVIMISSADGEILNKYLSTKQQTFSSSSTSISTSFNSSTTTSSSNSGISIQCEVLEKECIICQEEFQSEEILVKLSCCHLYHDHCLMKWLKNTPTCPLCRLKLPTEKKVVTAITNPHNNNNLNNENQQTQSHRLNYFV